MNLQQMKDEQEKLKSLGKCAHTLTFNSSMHVTFTKEGIWQGNFKTGNLGIYCIGVEIHNVKIKNFKEVKKKLNDECKKFAGIGQRALEKWIRENFYAEDDRALREKFAQVAISEECRQKKAEYQDSLIFNTMNLTETEKQQILDFRKKIENELH